MLDVTETVEARRMLEKRRAEVQSLVERLLVLQEEERSRLARELHDHIGQMLTAIKLKVAELERADPGSRRPIAADTLAMVDDALEGARTLSFDLRPAMLDELGLSNAVRAYARRQSDAAGLQLRLRVADDLHELPTEVQTAVYRILQEAVTNAIRHAEASTLTVRLVAEGGHLVLGVQDDGRGFRPARGGVHLGLLIMRERAEMVGGAVQISSSPGDGTVVTALFPRRGDEGP
ncbi:MAG TPA: sensor histidine kinase [Longimicrobiales bacterium]|nr:sensor histidine kinase [Longimicrobiales bacterium]